jgi:glycosyltransferase involved in cell wall biosynthesis
MLHSFKLTSWAKRIHQRMERKVLTSADRVITITPFYVEQLNSLSSRSIDLITNGFDEDDFKELKIEPTKKFVIRHIGVVNPACDPRPFMYAVKALAEVNAEFKNQVEVVFTGQVNADFLDFVKADAILSAITTFQSSVPHKEIVKLLGQSSVLLLVLTGYKDGEGFLPGKLFEYLATRLPIISTGPVPSDASKVLTELGYDCMVTGALSQEIETLLSKHFKDWRKGTLDVKQTNTNVFSRKQLTFKLVELLKSV